MESGDYGAGGDSGFREHRGVTESDEYLVAVCLGLIAGFPMRASHPEYPSLSVIAVRYLIGSHQAALGAMLEPTGTLLPACFALIAFTPYSPF